MKKHTLLLACAMRILLNLIALPRWGAKNDLPLNLIALPEGAEVGLILLHS